MMDLTTIAWNCNHGVEVQLITSHHGNLPNSLMVLSCVPLQTSTVQAFNLTIGINQMFNVIILSASDHFFVLLITFTWLGHRTNVNFGADYNEIVRR
jgi:hypothetical protein